MNRDTYFTLFFHLTFSTKQRMRLLTPPVQLRLQQYMITFCKNNGVVPLIINGVRDHMHLLFYVCSPSFCISDFVRELKKCTNKLCNESLGYNGLFSWQKGYFAQAISRDRVPGCYEYIRNQQKHHIGMTFSEEWEKMKAAYEKDGDIVDKYKK